MNISGIVGDLRKELQKKLDDAITQELQQLELEEAERAALAKELPGLVLPELTTKEEARAKELISKLDGQVDKLAELTASIAVVSNEYQQTIRQLTGLLANKEHNISTNHTKSKLNFMLAELGHIVEADVYNGILGFRGMPDKEYILSKLGVYRGIQVAEIAMRIETAMAGRQGSNQHIQKVDVQNFVQAESGTKTVDIAAKAVDMNRETTLTLA